MSKARWTFVVFVGIGVLMGLWTGITELINPAAANISFNGQDMTGFPGLVAAVIISAIVWAIVGLIVAGIVALFTRRKKPAA